MTMTDTETMSTEDVLVAMLTENTGRHFLDSGGAYGRHWEQNRGMTVADAMERPEISVSTWARDKGAEVEYVTLDVFHFLRARCDFDAELDAEFREFANAEEREREPWFACLDEWLTDIGATFEGGAPCTVNTYNGEDSLSQVIQYTMFDHPEDGETIAAVSIHGGCDVRGGYTAPRMFRIGYFGLADNADCEIFLSEPETPAAELAQGAMFDEYPVPTGGRRVLYSVRSGTIDYREGDPCDDAGLADIVESGFGFSETAIKRPDDNENASASYDGDVYAFEILDGPAAGWTVSFSAPYPSD